MEQTLDEMLPRSIVGTEREVRRMVEWLWTRAYQFACTEAPEPGNLRLWVSEIGWNELIEVGLIEVGLIEGAVIVPVWCPDGGTCHHGCLLPSACWRVNNCEPLSGVFPDDRWPEK